LRFYIAALIIVAIVSSCGREPRSGEASAAAIKADAATSIATIGPAGEARLFVADRDSSGARFCFESTDLNLAPGTPVTVVDPGYPQHFTSAALGRRTHSPCFPTPPGSVDSMEYAVDVRRDSIEWRAVPIAILGKLPPAEMRGDTVTIAIEPGQAPWRFRTCASEEGIHATAWSGVPLVAPRRWHAYYYLGYDVEPDCTNADYAPDSAGTR
jgi:hypothetical protein